MNALLTFTGFRDPFDKGLIEGEEVHGPVLTLLKSKKFDRVVLFSTPNTVRNTTETLENIRELFHALPVEIIELHIDDPTDYIEILRNLRKHYRNLSESLSESKIYISVSSGTPQMHACWLLLAGSGEIPAHIINVRPPRFVSKERPILAELDFTLPELPTVRTNFSAIESPDIPPDDLLMAQRHLGIVGDHSSMIKTLEACAALAPSDVPVLILGESGTGKELVAKLIHRLSGRKKDAFITLNCAAIPIDLFESMLFGHKKGAFTGALHDHDGKFAIADGGTLFLDEIGEVPFSLQAKFLRVLQDGLVEAIGAKRPLKVDVRVISATNQDLKKAKREGRFRDDLYYRLNVGVIKLPPLRKRKTDIPKVALFVLDRINERLKKPKRFSTNTLARLQSHQWPGNIRELENVIERTARQTRKDVIEPEDILFFDEEEVSDKVFEVPEPYNGFSMEEFLAETRKKLLGRALELSGGNQTGAAKLLGISPQAVHKFLKS